MLDQLFGSKGLAPFVVAGLFEEEVRRERNAAPRGTAQQVVHGASGGLADQVQQRDFDGRKDVRVTNQNAQRLQVIGVGAHHMSRGRAQLLDVQAATRSFADAFEPVFGAQADDGPQKVRLMHPPVVQQRRVRAGDRGNEHLLDAQELAHTPRISARGRPVE